MFKRDNSQESSNFWVSYADLMAGLLFVFILLIGAIVSKSILMREALYNKEQRLTKTMDTLKNQEERLKRSYRELSKLKAELIKQKRALNSAKSKISKQKSHIKAVESKIKLKEGEVRKLHILLEDLKVKLKKQRYLTTKSNKRAKKLQAQVNQLNQKVKKQDELITLNRDSLKLKDEELKRLNQLLLAKNTKIDELNKKIIILQNLDTNNTSTNTKKKLKKYINRVLVLSGKLTKAEDELKLKDEKLTKLLEALDEQKSKYEDLLKKLKEQKAKIKTLTGIRLKVISELKDTLGDKIAIDKKSGALRLSSKILFDRGSAKLKDRAKAELKETFEKYIVALMENRAIRPHLDKIVIEGHTDSDGGYLYNLELSQRRALEVMNFLLSLPISKEYNLKKYLVASGRAYMDPIMKNGKEDKNASRRIEIKFRLKNRDAMYEIERILDEDKK